jgi:type IV pilus assembly protein PilB
MAEASSLLIPTEPDEIAHAQVLARRYRCEYVDLTNFPLQTEVIHSIPVDLMFRYNFLPLEWQKDSLVIAVADPSRLMMLMRSPASWASTSSRASPRPRKSPRC